MSRKKELDVHGIIERTKAFLGIKTDIELASILNINQSAVSAWKRRGNINLNSIITICSNVSLDWLIYGEGTPDGSKQDEEPDHYIKSVSVMMEDMDEEQKRDIYRYTQKEKWIKDIKTEINGMRKAG